MYSDTFLSKLLSHYTMDLIKVHLLCLMVDRVCETILRSSVSPAAPIALDNRGLMH